ncbi:hypothetical protein [Nocardia sp. bgisy134]|uniref:hypothetical protein n=1 Tax=unclassified Nocardia TaxID=2637762 RepID=UPI003D708701
MTTTIEIADELATPLDLLPATSEIGVGWRTLPDTSWTRTALSLAEQPRTVAEQGALGHESMTIAPGRSARAPAASDWRFDDPVGRDNPLFDVEGSGKS